MVNPAINAAIIAAAGQQADAGKAILSQLREAGARTVRTAIPLDLSVKGSEAILAHLIKRGQVRDAGGRRYWIDEEAIARTKAAGIKASLIIAAFALSAAASLMAIAATR